MEMMLRSVMYRSVIPVCMDPWNGEKGMSYGLCWVSAVEDSKAPICIIDTMEN